MVPILDRSIWGDYGVLICPACGFNYLHHDTVEVFARDEDEELGVHVSVASGDSLPSEKKKGQSVTVSRDLTGNPSGRRGGVIIRFWCEGCHARPTLTVSQEKGETLVEVRA